MKRKIDVPIAIMLAIYSFIVSIIFLPMYVEGDQIHYKAFYQIAPSLDFAEGFDIYSSMLGSSEPGYYLLVYFFSGNVSKDILISFLNLALGYVIGLWLMRQKVSIPIIVLLFLNFYLFVLFLAAERLKLSLLFLMISILVQNRYRFIILGLSFFSHTQVIILVASKLASYFSDNFQRILRGEFRPGIIWNIVAVLGSLLLMYTMRDYMGEKYSAYSESGGIDSIVKPVLFLALTVFYGRTRVFESIAMHLPMVLASFLIGGDRVVIFSYFIFLYFALSVNRGLNAGVLVSSTYFALKGLIFLNDVVVYGHGFND